MKKILAIALFVGMAFSMTSCNNDKKMQTINTFAKTYFPDTEVMASIKDGLDYDVTLNDYTQIGFDGNLFGKLEWDEVDCKHAAQAMVPAALVPAEIANYVSRLHNNMPIVKLSKKTRGWEIELGNGVEIEFDQRFNVVDFDD